MTRFLRRSARTLRNSGEKWGTHTCPPSYLELQFQAVVGEADVGGQRGVGRFVRQVVTDVSEKGAPRLDALDDGQRALDSGMRGVRLVAKRVEKKDVEIAQALERR